MKLAIFSDVHGNLTALQAVLDDIARQDVAEIVFAGDLCLMGPRPEACLRRVRQDGVTSIYGNTDDFVLGRQSPPERFQEIAGWTRRRLDAGERAWLGSRPFAVNYQPTTNPEDALLVVHANPLDVNRIVFPSEAEQRERYKAIRQTDEQLAPLLLGTRAAVVAYGHLHIPGQRTIGAASLVNISSVSIPGDDDPRAKYGVFEWDEGQWRFYLRHVAYDVTEEIEAFEAEQPPGWQTAVDALERDGYVAQRV